MHFAASWHRVALTVPLAKKDALVDFSLCSQPLLHATWFAHVAELTAVSVGVGPENRCRIILPSEDLTTAEEEESGKRSGGNRRHELLVCLPLLPCEIIHSFGSGKWLRGWLTRRQTGALEPPEETIKKNRECFPREYYLWLSRRARDLVPCQWTLKRRKRTSGQLFRRK